MEEEILELELEGNAPEGWVTNTILIRNEKGELVEIEVPDDKEA